MAIRSDPPSTERAGPSYARFLVFLEAWILSGLKDCIARWLGTYASTRSEARGLGGFNEDQNDTDTDAAAGAATSAAAHA